MDKILFDKLYSEGLLSEPSLRNIKLAEENRLFSIYWPLRTILFTGITLLSGGLGILLYKNIDRIGHGAVLAAVIAISLGCFYYCYRKKNPFSFQKLAPPNNYFDYVLLLGCISFASFIAYLQFQYNVFGNRYGLALLAPLILFFFSAYYFDHLGVLSLAIANLGAWAGISLTPLQFLKEHPFEGGHLIFTGIALGVLLILGGVFSRRKNIKPHFEFSYMNFGIHILFLAAISGMCYYDRWFLVWLLVVLGIAAYFYWYALVKRSLYFMIVALLYGYFSLSYSVATGLWRIGSNYEMLGYLLILYFIGSSIALVRMFMYVNRKMKIQ